MDEASAQQGIAARRRVTRTILAVDDSRASLNTLAHRLGQLGYLVVLADRGAQALELISARGFNMVLLDRAMPDVPGLHILQEIRGSRDTADLPVIMLADPNDPGAAAEALDAGVDDYLARPFEFEELAARIERTLARSERIEELKRSNLALDARIAARAIELGEVRGELAAIHAERARLAESLQTLTDELDQLRAPSVRTSAGGRNRP